MASQDYNYINTQLYYMFKDTVFVFSLQSFNKLSASVPEKPDKFFFLKLCPRLLKIPVNSQRADNSAKEKYPRTGAGGGRERARAIETNTK